MGDLSPDWERLDKQKFIILGGVLFSGVTVTLFPLSVIKTRQQAIPGIPSGIAGTRETARSIIVNDGIRGFYRGLGTVVMGAIPVRVCYLTTLEATKSYSQGVAARLASNETQKQGLANLIAGAAASLSAQSITVPLDVVSSRLMVADKHVPIQPPAAQRRSSSVAGSGPQQQPAMSAKGQQQQRHMSAAAAAPTRHNGLTMARAIIQQEGFLGLYRGFGASVITFVPSSAIWWASYGSYQQALWTQVRRWRHGQEGTQGQVVALQTASGILAGCTSALLTNPLDVVKTRLQVKIREQGDSKPTFSGIARQLIEQEGLKGLWRGAAPRILNTCMWGTAMVSCYELLKRWCRIEQDEP